MAACIVMMNQTEILQKYTRLIKDSEKEGNNLKEYGNREIT